MRQTAQSPCKWCGGAILAHGQRLLTARFCSKTCQSSFSRVSRPVFRCEKCDKNILHNGVLRGRAWFCSKACQVAAFAAKRRRGLSQDRLQEVMRYDQGTGVFTWKDHHERNASVAARETVAGWADDMGYVHIRVDGRLYLAHRLAWLYVYGIWPPDQIDHKNGIPGDNAIENLRASDQQQNTWNAKRSIANTSGFKGVAWSKQKQKWRAYIKHNGKQKFLGYHDSLEAASVAFRSAVVSLRGEFGRLS